MAYKEEAGPILPLFAHYCFTISLGPKEITGKRRTTQQSIFSGELSKSNSFGKIIILQEDPGMGHLGNGLLW